MAILFTGIGGFSALERGADDPQSVRGVAEFLGATGVLVVSVLITLDTQPLLQLTARCHPWDSLSHKKHKMHKRLKRRKLKCPRFDYLKVSVPSVATETC